uniref:Uncharacterized protein n=1 Tax=Schizophyllum commune (strain H4-8 / FGSC 9210) TaxID=578458 RepID=D8Q0G2_SCHCM
MAEDSNSLSIPSVSQIVDARAPTFMHDSRQTDSANMDMTSQSQLLHMKEPTFMPPPECSEIQEEPRDEPVRTLRGTSSSSSAGSRPSDGQLNRAFKFGGLPSPSPVKEQPQDKPLTLSDIIPPPSHVRSLSNSSQSQEADSSIEDDSVLKSIFAKATNLPGQDMPRVRTDSSASSQFFQDYSRQAQDSHSAELSRPASGISFTGFDSFEEVRRGFEFNDNRPAFYPPPSSRNNSHNRHESLFSIASVEPSAENAWGLAPDARPKIGSAARRAALGWTKRSNKSSAGQKENVGQGTLATPGDSLRINRARPRARQTPATQSRSIRI